MWQSQAPAGAAQTPPLSPWPQPWHPIHLAPASPRPSTPLRSGAVCRPRLPPFQVSAGFLSSGTGSASPPPRMAPEPPHPARGWGDPPSLAPCCCCWCLALSPSDGWLGKCSGEAGELGGCQVSVSVMLLPVTRSGCNERCVCAHVLVCACGKCVCMEWRRGGLDRQAQASPEGSFSLQDPTWRLPFLGV